MNIAPLEPLRDVIPLYPVDIDQFEAKAIQLFADANGFTYQPTNSDLVKYDVKDYKKTPAWLGMAGYFNSKQAYNVVSGIYKAFPLSMFLMWSDITDGVIYENPTEEQKRAYVAQQTAGIIRIQLPKVFPQIVLDSNKNDRFQSSIRTEYERNQRLTLEGDFNNYFDLYAPTGLQVNVLTLLAPNMMQIAKDHAGLFDVEFYGSEMIFITRASLYDPRVMKALDDALSEQLTYLKRLLKSWNYQPIKPPFDHLTKPYITGSTLKFGKIRISAKLQLIGIAAGLVLFGLLIILTN